MNMRLSLLFIGVAVALWTTAARAGSCESLTTLISSRTQVVLAQTIEAGSFTPPDTPRPLQELPKFCRTVVKMNPTSDSDIGAEVWLPAHWNNKLLIVGSGGWGGAIDYQGMASALRRGYAVGATDDGHRSAGGSFVMGHPQKLIDFAYRAEHVTTLEAKALVKALYAQVRAILIGRAVRVAGAKV